MHELLHAQPERRSGAHLSTKGNPLPSRCERWSVCADHDTTLQSAPTATVVTGALVATSHGTRQGLSLAAQQPPQNPRAFSTLR